MDTTRGISRGQTDFNTLHIDMAATLRDYLCPCANGVFMVTQKDKSRKPKKPKRYPHDNESDWPVGEPER